MESSSSSEDPTAGGQERIERRLSRNFSDSTVHSVSSRGVERGDSLHSLGSQLPAPKTTRPIQRSTWNSSRNLSERSLLSTTSSILTAPILEGEDEESMLLAEKLQNEEIIQRVLEQSVTDLSCSNSFLSSQQRDTLPMFVQESPPVTGISSTQCNEPPQFEASRGVDLSAELYELDPSHTPPKRRSPLEEDSTTQNGRSIAIENEILDLRIGQRQLSQMPNPDFELGYRLTGGRGISHPTNSSRSLRSISSHNSIGSQHITNAPDGTTLRTGQLNNGSLSSDCSRAIPPTVTSTPNTSQRSLPGAVSVPTPAKLTKTPDVRAAIEKFVSQPIQNSVDPPTVLEDVECTQESSESKTETVKQEVSDQPVLKYKYKAIDASAPKMERKEPAWKTVSPSESSYLGHGWPALKPSALAAKKPPATVEKRGYEHEHAVTSDHISLDELKQIEVALLESEKMDSGLDCKPSAMAISDTGACKEQVSHDLSAEDSLAIADALRQAEEEEKARREEDERRSLEVALMMQREEDEMANADLSASRPQHQGNIRTVSREEFAVQRADQSGFTGPAVVEHDDDGDESDEFVSDGFRMNTIESQKWSRINRDVVVGPDKKQRTKHDAMLNGKSNAYRLGLEQGLPSIGNTTYNSFMKSTKTMTKGVASSGVGRAGRDSGGTKSGALDENVRLIASKAINRGFIDKMNGVVNEGKEAVVYHADAGPESDNFAVAVKAFKRIQEFRSRGDYVDGDPRYRTKFSDVGAREQLEIWAEKEFRNLVRANAAGIAVPFPLWTKDNVVFMRFLGNIRPCPQIRELDLHHGSKRWSKLYEMVLDSIRR